MGFISSKSVRGFLTINRQLLPSKLHYGLMYGGTATTQPTMPIYAKVFHFSTFIVGLIYTILPLVTLILKPLFSTIADKYKWHRGICLTWLIIQTMAYFCIMFIPPAELPINNNSTKRYDMDTLALCSVNEDSHYFQINTKRCEWTCDMTEERCSSWNLTQHCQFQRRQQLLHGHNCSSLQPVSKDIDWASGCTMMCNGALAREADDDDPNIQDDETTYKQWQFWVFLALLMAAWSGTFIATTLSDTIIIEICGSDLYGKQRLWGSIFWGVISLINGFLIDAFSTEGEEKNYLPAFYLSLVPMILDFIVFYTMKFEIPQRSENIASDVWKVMLEPRNLVASLWCMMVGVAFGVLWGYLYWLLEDLAEAMPDTSVTANIKTIEGWVMAAQCFLGELPAFYFGGWIVNKIGHGHCFTLIMTLIGLRFTFYGILVNPWWCIPIEFFQNNYGIFYSTMTSFAKKTAKPGTEATIQSILAAFCEGVGVAVGSFLGGLFYKQYGGNTTFLIFGITFFLAAITNECIEFGYRRVDRKTAKAHGGDVSEEKRIFS